MPSSQPDVLAELGRVDLPEIIGDAAGKVARFYMQPGNLSGLAGSTLLPLVIFRRKPPLIPYLIVAAAGWAVGAGAYRASRDLHELAAAARTGD